MNAFEDWKNKNCEVKNCPHEASCNGCETLWREALKWLEAAATAIELHGSGDGFDIVDLHDLVKEELGEES